MKILFYKTNNYISSPEEIQLEHFSLSRRQIPGMVAFGGNASTNGG